MQVNLNGYTAVVGGSSRGLGLAIAYQLAASGATVTLMARNEQKLEALIKELPSPDGQRHTYLVVDYADFKAYQERVTGFFQDKAVDILVNNTNGPSPGTVLQKGIAEYQQAFDLLFKSYHLLTHLLLPKMHANGYGRIINVSSTSVKEPIPNLALSNTIRAAVINWAKSLSREVAPFGITVNNILTGSFDTERISEILQAQAEQTGASLEKLAEEKRSKIPAGRFGKPEEFGYLAAFLASPFAGYINGANIPIDGGYLTAI
nr:SDR family oxidoreductase [Cytophagales bacterium]